MHRFTDSDSPATVVAARIFCRRSLFLLLAAAANLSAAPVINSVMNAASNLGPVLPNASIAPGSIFIVKGTGLGPANLTVAPAAFQSTLLAGTSITLTVAGTTVNALMYYTSATQLAALLPSNTPPGGGTLTVTYNGQSSPVTAFRGVASNNLAIFTVDSTGQGPAIVTFPDYSLVSNYRAANCGGPNTTCGAANPGDTLILWGTGLGAISGSDAAGAGLGVAMPNIPLRLWLGGVQLPVTYQGRSGCCIGEDQIVFTIPDNAPLGCGVPFVAQINNQISNHTILSVAPRGSRTCTPNNAALASVDITKLQSPLSFGDFSILKVPNGGSTTGVRDEATFVFARATVTKGLEPWAIGYGDPIPLNSCLAYPNLNGHDNQPFDSFEVLDGGAAASVRGPNGTANVALSTDDPVTLSQAGTFIVPGQFTIAGSGGKEVGAFSATIASPAIPTLVSPTTAAGLTVSRANGMTVTWRGGDLNGAVNIFVNSETIVARNNGSSIRCRVAASAGSFTIPPYAMLTLAAGGLAAMEFGTAETQAPFNATGISLGLLRTQMTVNALGVFTLQ